MASSSDSAFSTAPESDDAAPASAPAGVRQSLKSGVADIGTQAVDQVRQFAQDSQTKAGDFLDHLSALITDAAAQVDEKLGDQYGDYARTAAEQVQGFADTVRAKDVDDLADDVRGYVRQSPGVAVGVAAALGFVAARLIHAGLDAGRA